MRTAKIESLPWFLRFLLLAWTLWPASPGHAQSQPQPYLVLIPSGGAPDIVEEGTTVKAFGSNFCASAGCSSVTLTIGNDIVKPQVIATVSVQSDGTFITSFVMHVPFPWRYMVTATQEGPNGNPLTASVGIGVPAGDEREVQPPPTAAERAVDHDDRRPIHGLSEARQIHFGRGSG